MVPDEQDDLAEELKRVKRLAAERRHVEEEALCTELIGRFPTAFEPLFSRAHAKWILRDHSNAIQDLTKAIQLNPAEPALFYFRGVWSVELTEYADGIADLARAVALDEALGSSYYARDAHFVQAIGHVFLGQFEQAEQECKAVSARATSFICGSIWTYDRLRRHIAFRRRP
jgi:tetratricopeptide (TPR) repeat protein